MKLHPLRDRPARAVLAVAAAAVAGFAPMTVACSGGDDAETSVAATDPSPDVTGAGDDSEGASSGACPSEALVSTALGVDMVVEPNPPASAAGFCPYTSADGVKSLTADIMFASLDLTQDAGGGETVDGVGERALWSTIDQLNVWTGTRSILISIQVLGPGHDDVDERTASIALAQAVLAADPG